MELVRYILKYKLVEPNKVEHQGPREMFLEGVKTDEEARKKASQTTKLEGSSNWVKIKPYELLKVTYRSLKF